jgi:hypothetical protein
MKLIALVGGLLACCSCQGGLPPTAGPVAVATIETAICIVTTTANDVKAGKSPAAIVADCITTCGSDAATIASVLDANHALMLADQAASSKTAMGAPDPVVAVISQAKSQAGK